LVQVRKIKNRKRVSQLRAEESQDIKRRRTEKDRKQKALQRKRESDEYREYKCHQRRSDCAAREKSCKC
jgi:hypothetical protein